MQSPNVSIIIPAHNAANTIKRCLDSVINNTLANIEIICIDDASTDNTVDIIASYKDSRIRLIQIKYNSGVSVARNIGINKAHGEYLGFIDADDTVDSDFFEKLYKNAKQTYSDIVKAELTLVFADNSSHKITDLQNTVRENKYKFVRNFTSAIYNRKMLNTYNIRFPENLYLTEDTIFLINAVHHANKVSVIDNTTYYYFRTPDSSDGSKYSHDKVVMAITAYKTLLNQINEWVDLDDDKYDVISAYVGQLALYPCEKASNVNDFVLLADGIIWVYKHIKRPVVLHDVFGKKIINAIQHNDIKSIIYQIAPKRTVRFLGIPLFKKTYNLQDNK